MATVTALSNEHATLVYHEDSRIVHHTFHEVIAGENFRTVLNNGVELLRKHGAKKWLSDDRMIGALNEEDTQWSMNDWFPRAKAAGWKFWALVVPADIMARMNLKEFVDSYYEQGLRIMVFTDPEAAMEWLTKQSG
jgi:hypothetical protein